MSGNRLAWQIPILLLLTIPLWQGTIAQFLTLPQTPFTAPLHQDSSFMLEEVLYSEVTSGDETLALKAKRLHGKDQGSGFTLEGADAQRLGDNPLHITANNAFFDPEQQILTLMDDVVVETTSLLVRTQALRYLAKFEIMKSASEVALRGEGIELTGTSFMYDLRNGDLRVGERVHFLYTPPPAQ